jgi:hypothetical protein
MPIQHQWDWLFAFVRPIRSPPLLPRLVPPARFCPTWWSGLDADALLPCLLLSLILLLPLSSLLSSSSTACLSSTQQGVIFAALDAFNIGANDVSFPRVF